ncbi:protein-disulfide reductase DsbD [Nitratifractor sp.]
MSRTIRLFSLILLLQEVLLAGFGTAPSGGGFESQRKFLSPQEAFKAEAKIDGDRIKTRIKLGEKIHIYAKDLHYRIVKPVSLELHPKLPEPHDFDGDKVYSGTLEAEIPLETIREKVQGPFTLEIDMTGCSDAGICYQPQKFTFDLVAKSPEPKAQSAASQNPKPKTQNLPAFGSLGGFGGLKQKFLSPQEAFRAEAKIQGERLLATIKLGEKIHIYAKDLKFSIVKPKKLELHPKLPTPVEYEGDKVYYGTFKASIPLSELQKAGISGPFTLQINLAGCSDAGICYQPQKFTFDLVAPSTGKTTASNAETASAIGTQHPTSKIQNSENSEGFFGKVSRLAGEGNSAKIAQALAKEGILFVLLLFFVAGLLLALTPCILPMIPILSSILVKQAGKEGGVSRSTSFLISLVYVTAMAATYALIGIVAGLLGFDLQAHLNNPWVIIPLAGLFVALALSLFGYYELGLPASWQSRLSRASDEAQGKGLLGTAVMGALSALIVGTCTAPVISGAIIFISSTGDAVLGGLSLFVMGIGAGMPLLLMGAGADKLIPKPGGWMTRVSQIFGVVMLAMALYILRGILDPFWFLILMSLLLMGSALYMSVFDDSGRRQGAAKLFSLLAWVLLLLGSILFVGALGGAKSLLDPLAPFTAPKASIAASPSASEAAVIPMAQRRGYTLERLQSEIAAAAAAGKPVIVDIGKENCAACTELEHITFPDPRVREAMKRFKFIQIDITENTPQEQAILKHFRLFGAPNILFFDSKGRPLPEKFLVGFVKPEAFVRHLEGIR